MKIVLFISMFIPVLAMAHKIEVVKESNETINTNGLNAYVCNYDEIKNSSVLLKKDFEKHGKITQETKSKLIDVARCHNLILAQKLKKHPAILIDGKYLTYGETDVAKALIECKRQGYCND